MSGGSFTMIAPAGVSRTESIGTLTILGNSILTLTPNGDNGTTGLAQLTTSNLVDGGGILNFVRSNGATGFGAPTIAASPTGATVSGTTVTITTLTPHGFAAGQTVVIAGNSQHRIQRRLHDSLGALHDNLHIHGHRQRPGGFRRRHGVRLRNQPLRDAD